MRHVPRRAAAFLPSLRQAVAQSSINCHGLGDSSRILAHPVQALRAHVHPLRYHSTRTWRAHGSEESTIYALSTAPGRAAIAIIRISGPACKKIYHSLCPSKPLPRPRYAALRTLHTPDAPTSILDSGALVLYFPSPNTSTGESVLELHVHGGPAIIRAILAAIASLHTSSLPIRYAQAGEFTRRAFLADRLSLPQIEALGDTLSAETEEQRRLSVAGTRSGLAARYESWRQQLLSARGELEALIDFSEDQHFDESPGELAANVAHLVRSLIRVMTLHSANAMRGELLRAGIKLSLIGAPNVGKSSLLNQIVGRRAAIVSAQAGTTRDVVEVGIDLGGFFCRLGDTAGLRVESTVGDVEAEGIRMAKERALESDVIVLVASIELGDATDLTVHIAAEVLETANELLKRGKRVVVALNKVDRVEKTTSFSSLIAQTYNLLPALTPGNVFPISCHQAEENASDGLQVESPPHNTSTTATNPPFGDPGNIQALLTGLTSIFRTLTSAVPPIPTSTTDITSTPGTEADESTYADALSATARQRNLLDSCTAELRTFLSLVDNANDTRGVETDLVLAAEALRSAASCLAQITGKGGEVGMGGDVEEVLGVVFERFCVGK